MKLYIDRFSAVLLDMHGTFMFGHDRFGEGEDFHATYRGVGPDAVVHVGDSLEHDVAGARAAGLASVWIGNAEDAHGHAMAPDVVIETLRDLPCVAARGPAGDASPEPGGA